MIAKMMVCEEKEVEIPDLPADMMTLIARHNGSVCLWAAEGFYEEGGSFSELWVNVVPSSQDEEHDALLDALNSCESYNESTMSDLADQPYFQSDAADGIEPFEQFINLMKRMYPYTTIT